MRTAEQSIENNESFKKAMIEFGKWVKTEREARNISLDGLAKQVGICKSYLYRIETGERKSPNYITVVLLARILGRDLDDIMKNCDQAETLLVT